MTSILRTCSETDELGGGRFRHVQHLKPVAYAVSMYVTAYVTLVWTTFTTPPVLAAA